MLPPRDVLHMASVSCASLHFTISGENTHPGHGVPVRRYAKAERKSNKSPPWNPCGCLEASCPLTCLYWRKPGFGPCVSETSVTRRTRCTPFALLWTVWETGTGGTDAAQHLRCLPWCKISNGSRWNKLPRSLDVDCARQSIHVYAVVIFNDHTFFEASSKELSVLLAELLWWPLSSH